MLAGNIKVMDGVAEIVAVAEQTRFRVEGDVEIQAALRSFGAWLNSKLHHTLSNRGAVAKTGGMANGVIVKFHVANSEL